MQLVCSELYGFLCLDLKYNLIVNLFRLNLELYGINLYTKIQTNETGT